MVTRCLKALDRLDEVSQHIYKKSSVQVKVSKIESRLNKLSKKSLKKDGLEKQCCTKTKTKEAVCCDMSSKCVEKQATIKRKETFLPQPKHQQCSDLRRLNSCRHVKIGPLKPRKSACCNKKLRSFENNTQFISLDEDSLFKCNEIHVQAEEKSHQPLCWEEQINSKQVKILEVRKPTPASHQIKKIESHPVVFHDKEWIEEMLKKRTIKSQLASCCLPQFHVKEENTKITEKRRRKDARQLRSRPFKIDKLELRGRGMNNTVNDSRQFSFHEFSEKNLRATINESNVHGGWDIKRSTKQQSVQRNGNSLMMLENINGITQPNVKPITSPKKACDETAVLSNKLQFDISVCLPNASSTGEEITKNSETFKSEINKLESQTKQCDVNSGKLSSQEIIDDSKSEYSLKITTHDDNTNRVNSSASISETAGDQMNNDKPISKKKLRENNVSSNSCPNLPKFTERRSPNQRSLSSRCVHTPLFLADDIIELPRGVSPGKAMMELRQSFCENIRKETRQLEFDLQELYLKKRLHNR